MNWEEIDRLRRLVPESIDRHLANWGRWTERYKVGIGHRHGSTGFASLERQVDTWTAQTADAVIDGLPIHLRQAIEAVYVGGAWRLRADLLASSLLEAAELFGQRGRRKGLVQ